MNKIKRARGITLIEVLATLFILATGLLGMAALQSRSLSYSNIAYLNARASMLAYDMLDRIKANPVYSIDGPGYITALGNTPNTYVRDCEIADCSPLDLAQYDVNQWKFIVDQQLPEGDASIQRVDTPEGRTYSITVFFDASKGQEVRRRIQIRSTL